MESIDLTLQPADADDQLTAFLISPAGTAAFAVPLPAQLGQLHQVWLRRFLAHHDSGGDKIPPATVREYGNGLCSAMASWLQQPQWQPLRTALEQLPDLPLRLRCSGTAPLIERLPWEALPLGRPIWRLDGPPAAAAPSAPQRTMRRPRLLLLVGDEHDLDLSADIAQLERLSRQRRIELVSLRGQACSLAGLRTALHDPQGWDVLVFIGHSAGDPQGGGRLQLGDASWLGGHALQSELQQAGSHGLSLVLLNSCAGLDLARCCTSAGIPWALCFREAVPTHAASLAFTALLEQLEQGMEFTAALEQVRRTLAASGPVGSELLLSAMGAANATELVLPLSARQRFWLRLAASKRTQAIAAAALVSLGAVGELLPGNPLSTYLLDRRLYVQRLWRQATSQGSPTGPPLAVLLLDERRAYPALGVTPTPGRVARAALAEVLRRTSPTAVPVVGLDVVFDEQAPNTDQLADVIRQQQRQRVVGGWFGADTIAPKPGFISKPLGELSQAGLLAGNLAVGTTGAAGRDRQPMPLRLTEAITADNFAAALTTLSNPRLPPEAVIDWSIDWLPLITLINVEDLPALQAQALVVGTDGRIDTDQADLFQAPGAIRPDLPSWGGAGDVLPGALVQAVLAQSMTLGHWLTPSPLPAVSALSAGLGVLLAAAVPRRRQRIPYLLTTAALTIPLCLQVAISRRILIPIALPLTAAATTALIRRD
ncbi:CHAT domain-containing protein [Cyanobium sp. ATX 6A2]|uniref:CHAT domain-containing protein n=1 Tax=Cyanobium sp. ATX 6A2 TaxID=2823700 RepID=UPI0020CEDFAA|nr:CHAT domain-containing protein [Cyanobium sp. ATX 6A2]MCP9887852.1 CHAT domain-containing protein [Cyanobium sp. ATX 6A2]